MKKISESEVIYKAFKDTVMGTLPKKEADWPDWYRKRMEACAGCKYNTKNIPRQFIPTGRLYFSKIVGKYCCAICGCYIPQKAWSKTEQCSIGETAERPSWLPYGFLSASDRAERSLWNRMELVTMDEDEVNIVSTDPDKYNVDLGEDGEYFDVKVSPTRFGDSTEFSFIMETKHAIMVTGITAGCQCTVPKLDYLDDRHIKLGIFVTTERWGAGFADKPLTVKYRHAGMEEEDPEGEIRFMFHLQVSKEGMSDDEIDAVVKRNEELSKAEEAARKAKEEEMSKAESGENA